MLKAAALGYFLIANHPFVDGNKRIGHAALEVTLVLNGFDLIASVDEQEKVVLAVASGKIAREAFTSNGPVPGRDSCYVELGGARCTCCSTHQRAASSSANWSHHNFGTRNWPHS